jgi:hypothetical protein
VRWRAETLLVLFRSSTHGCGCLMGSMER